MATFPKKQKSQPSSATPRLQPTKLLTAPKGFKTGRGAKKEDPAEIEKSMVLAVKSTFGEQAQTVVDMMEANNSDGATSLVTKAIIQSIVKMLPVAEQVMIKSGTTRGVYSFNSLVTSIRELLGDLKAHRDQGALGQSIVERSIRPSYMDIAVQIVTAFTLLQSSAKDRMTPEDFKEFRALIDENKSGLAGYITAQYEDVSEKVVRSLS